MSDIIFKQPPLVEVVAELRWDVPTTGEVPEQFAGVPLPVRDSSAYEIQFMNFAGKAGAKGFGLVERVIPPGFPLMARQVAYRYRKATGAEGAPLFQLGPGVFTVNLVPPYKSWRGFLPHIELGLEMLLESMTENNRIDAFTEVRLRYIDVFGENLRQGRPAINFLEEGLGISVKLPPSLTQYCTDHNQSKLNLSVSLPIDQGNMDLNIGERWVRNTRSLVMETVVTRKGPIHSDKNNILDSFTDAHRIIHDSFVAMTEPLHKFMEPVSED